MVLKKKKISARRKHVRETLSAERLERMSELANGSLPLAYLILTLFVAGAVTILSIDVSDGMFGNVWKPYQHIIALSVVVLIIAIGSAIYIHHYQYRIIAKPSRMIALFGLFLVLLLLTKFASMWPEWTYLATGAAVTSAIILTIAYNQRFAIGMTLFYCSIACLATSENIAATKLFLAMMSGVVTCCYSLKEIRTRMKLIEVSVLAAIVVFVIVVGIGYIESLPKNDIFLTAGSAAAITVFIGLVIQGFLPLIEKVFGIATSMTLLDYSDANQPLLKKLAMEAPGTFSHSLLIGSIAEAGAESIGANGLLCRVGAYYHDIGKINKPPYFIENQMGSASRHEQLSPAMSQLVIVGHVKDGIEIAKEYGLPAVLRQFIETHHGTTLIEYFYNEAKKKQGEKDGTVSESEFRYPGPKPRTKEAAIVMIADGSESATRSLTDQTPTKIETLVHNMAMKRLQDGQLDECDLTLRELHLIEASISKSLAAHHHGRIAYPNKDELTTSDNGKKTQDSSGDVK